MEKSYEKVVDFVQEQILDGIYSAGDKLPSEREMAQQLNVSRTSVREGLRILEQMGALSCQQGSGNYITGDFENTLIRVMTLMFAVEGTTYREISEFRYALESQALSLAILHATEEQIEEMDYHMSMLESATEETVRSKHDKRIHYLLVEASHNNYLIVNFLALTQVMDKYVKDMRVRILRDGKNRDGLMESHRDLIKSVRDKDVRLGHEALERHFVYIYNYLDS
ncbi:MAG: FadR/GntR family transcriptional regulator [Lachnospiraceae bacterium]|jgi:GntR family transcriptional repressor for pyruvate dehydrogenase complex|nr:FadR/GntR family transcriptional regulator [Lachnospiraceae bacterium]